MLDAFSDFALISFFIRVFYFAVTIVASVLFLRWFDWSLGIRFKSQVWDKIHEDPRALAQYHGLRFVGVVYCASQFLS